MIFVILLHKFNQIMGTKINERLNKSGIFIMVGLLFVSFSLFQSVKLFKSYDREVSVKGLAEMEVSADKVIWPVAYKEIGNDMVALYNTINQKIKSS